MIKHALSLLFIFLAPTTPIMCCSELAHLKWYESISKIIPASNVVENSNFMSFNEDPRKEPQIEVAEDKIPLGLTIELGQNDAHFLTHGAIPAIGCPPRN